MKKRDLVKGVMLSAVASVVLTGCNQPEIKPSYDISFKNIDAPITDEQKMQILASPEVTVNGKTHKIKFHTIARTGQKLPSLDGKSTEIFGLVKDEAGNPMTHQDGSPFVCKTSKDGSGPDHTTLHEGFGHLFAITQFECAPGAMYISRLEKTNEGGFKAVATSHISQAEYKGGWIHCAGQKTPWGSHLGSEEYEPNAIKEHKYYPNFESYFSNSNTEINPYYWGWTPEVKITSSNGDTEYVKHYSMGRFAHELAYVMPDEKTVYLTDDGTNGALFMFVANEPRNLESGTLYAAKLTQKESDNGGSFDVKWINLGNTSNFIIQNFVESKPQFSDLFESAKPNNGECPSGFKSINTTAGHECLKIKAGMDTYASRLESRRYAAYMGATTEFRKKEGIAFDKNRNNLYVAISRIQYGMEDFKKKGKPESKYDIGGSNDMKLPLNSCGGVYRSDVKGGQKDASSKPKKIDSEYVMTNFNGEVFGEMKKYDKNHKYANNKCNVNKIAEPDNLTFIDNSNTLIIGEDTGAHQIDYIWAYDVKTKKLDRILTSPFGSETTSPFWYPNIAGKGYMTTVIQHPFGESDKEKAQSPKDTESWIGVVGPFPAQ
jgi:secreted PhoX family phosphatase